MGSDLFKLMHQEVMVLAPRLASMDRIALDTLRGVGHFGVQWVLDRLQKNYRWRGMDDTVVKVVKACLSCARV